MRRKDLAEAVVDFAAAEKPRTVAPKGQRPEIGPGYALQKARMLRKFAAMLPGHAVCDLSKAHIDAFMNALPKQHRRPSDSPKSRNHYRGVLKQFLNWAVRNDYLPVTHRLFEAESLRPEKANVGETAFYTAKEFRALLETAEGAMRPMIAIGGLAGLRIAEILRLDWADVWRVPGHIEVTAGKSKTRQRRLVEICPALAAWLRPYRQFKSGQLWQIGEHKFHKRVGRLCEHAEVERKQNGLRHSFCTYHFAAHANENLTAQQAGNSPQMIHAHYKGLATKVEARQWFGVKPAKAGQNIISLSAVSRTDAH